MRFTIYRGWLLCASLLVSLTSAGHAVTRTQIDRYATVSNQAMVAQINPLETIAQFRFQPNIRTVSDAIRQVLSNTSYQLVPYSQLSRAVQQTLQKSLPITVRQLGPISIQEALLVLMGKDVFNISVDPVHRLISFRLKPKMKHIFGVSHAH